MIATHVRVERCLRAIAPNIVDKVFAGVRNGRTPWRFHDEATDQYRVARQGFCPKHTQFAHWRVVYG
jgi:hypothetical protein